MISRRLSRQEIVDSEEGVERTFTLIALEAASVSEAGDRVSYDEPQHLLVSLLGRVRVELDGRERKTSSSKTSPCATAARPFLQAHRRRGRALRRTGEGRTCPKSRCLIATTVSSGTARSLAGMGTCGSEDGWGGRGAGGAVRRAQL